MQSASSIEAERGLRRLAVLAISTWIGVGGILLQCAIFQLQPPYWQSLAWGAIMVIAGSAMTQLLPKCRGHKWLKWARAVVIGIVIASGTFVSTYGWNERSRYFNSRVLLETAALEWRLNDLRNCSIEFTVKYIREHNYEKRPLFELPTHWHIVRVADITKLSRSSREQSSFVLALLQYVTDIDSLCLRLDSLNGICGTGLVKNEDYHKMLDQVFGRDEVYSDYLASHRLLEKALAARYPKIWEQANSLRAKPQTRPDALRPKRLLDSQTSDKAAQDPNG
jgi:hypothetical protein